MDGFERVEIGGENVFFAMPEKALVDTWHWLSGAWTQERHGQMRYQLDDGVSMDRVRYWARRYGAPRLVEAVENLG